MTNVVSSAILGAVFLKFPGGGMRPVEIGDAPHLYVWVNDPELRPYFHRTNVESFQDEEEWIKNLTKRNHHTQVWMIVLDDGTIVGTMGLHGINWIDRTATTGAMFGNTKLHNNGIGFKAKMVLLKHAFDVLNLRQVYSEVIGYNLRSKAYSEKCGYREYGRVPNDIHYDGEFYDRVLMVVTKDIWQPIWDTFQIEHQIESFKDMLQRHGNVPRTE